MVRAAGTGFAGPGKRLASTSPGPWKTDARWKRIRTRHGRAIKFIETYCRPPKGTGHGQPLKLGRFQKEFLEAALADGIDAAILQTPVGNGKSTGFGALAVWALFDGDETGAPQVPIIATTITQAVRSCYGVAVSMVKNEPELLNRSLIYTGISQPRVVVPFNDGEMFPIANDVDGLQGLDYSLTIMDEIGFQPPAAWDAVQMREGKRERSLAVGVGTPGLDRDNALYQTRQMVREGGDKRGLVFIEYSVPESAGIDDRAAWRKANPAIAAGFLRMGALENARARSHEGPFRVYRLGQWWQGVDSWLGDNGAKLWEDLTSPYDFVGEVPTFTGVDVALKHDTSAIASVQRRPDGRYHAICDIWRPTDERPVDATDLMQYLRDLDAMYDVQAVSYDPRFFDVPAKMLFDEGLPMIEAPQSVERMTAAVGSLYEAILAGKITHDGDEAFTTQILNAVARYSDRGFTLSKGKSRGKIDAAIALALAFDQALRHEDVSTVYTEERGMLEIG